MEAGERSEKKGEVCAVGVGGGSWKQVTSQQVREKGASGRQRRVGLLALGALVRPAPAGISVPPETMQRSPLEKASVVSKLFFR